MLTTAAPCDEVMHRFADFIADDNLVAHNASFDKRFLDAELARLARNYSGKFACSLLVARRIYPFAPNHKLATLIDYKNIQSNGGFHRALYDSEMTAQLWLSLLADIKQQISSDDVPFSLIEKLSKTAKKDITKLLKNW